MSLFTVIATAAVRQMSEFTIQELANTAWAFATLNRADQTLFVAVAADVQQGMRKLNSQVDSAGPCTGTK